MVPLFVQVYEVQVFRVGFDAGIFANQIVDQIDSGPVQEGVCLDFAQLVVKVEKRRVLVPECLFGRLAFLQVMLSI